jgi:hypothetical protein
MFQRRIVFLRSEQSLKSSHFLKEGFDMMSKDSVVQDVAVNRRGIDDLLSIVVVRVVLVVLAVGVGDVVRAADPVS